MRFVLRDNRKLFLPLSLSLSLSRQIESQIVMKSKLPNVTFLEDKQVTGFLASEATMAAQLQQETAI
jgi:hypothetical protein